VRDHGPAAEDDGAGLAQDIGKGLGRRQDHKPQRRLLPNLCTEAPDMRMLTDIYSTWCMHCNNDSC
jgi:hypothetical protein